MSITWREQVIKYAKQRKEVLSKEYGVPTSALVWMGNNNFVMVKDGKQYWINDGGASEIDY